MLKIVATAKEVGVLPPEAPLGQTQVPEVVPRQVPGVVPRHVPGVVPIMFRGMSGGYNSPTWTIYDPKNMAVGHRNYMNE